MRVGTLKSNYADCLQFAGVFHSHRHCRGIPLTGWEDLHQFVILAILVVELVAHVEQRDSELGKIIVDWLLPDVDSSISLVFWELELSFHWWQELPGLGLESGVLIVGETSQANDRTLVEVSDLDETIKYCIIIFLHGRAICFEYATKIQLNAKTMIRHPRRCTGMDW
jgi:hypothetical protein